MNQFHKLFRWAWSVIVICALAFAMGGCEGDDGAQGPIGAEGPAGPAGAPGQDLTLDVVEAAVAEANVESCSTCHDGIGTVHQAVYDEYVSGGTLAMTIDSVTSVANVAGGFDLTVFFSMTKNGLPFDENPANFTGKSFWFADRDAAGEFVTADPTQRYNAFFSGYTLTNGVGAGDYEFSINVPYDVNTFTGGAFFASIGMGPIDFPDQTNAPPNGRLRGYKETATAAYPLGGGLAGWQSAANVDGCQACHGTPYRKHGYIEAVVGDATIPDFANCKSCHLSDQDGGHPDWQWMVDDPLAWATDSLTEEEVAAAYPYTRNLMNDVHMSHAMEFPYPMSMANCATCHAGKLADVTAMDKFTPETCKSCHPVDGVNAWPATVGTTAAGKYAQSHRAPPLKYLWAKRGVEVVHNFVDIDAADCATNCHGANYPAFSEYHSGYDETIYDDLGNRYADTNTVSVDAVTVAGDLITVEFSATNAAINPTLAISFYGWDTKHFIVAAHDRDANGIDCPHNSRPGCNIEWSPGSTKPFFTEETGSVAGDWIVTFDMSLYQSYKTDPIPTLIADGKVKFIEIAVLPRLSIGGQTVNIEAVTRSYDLVLGAFKDDYFQGAKATVDFDKCKACHDNVTTLVHTGSGRFGDSMQTCKACHATTFDGGHLELQSRSIDSYVHGIHAFQPLDEEDAYEIPEGATAPDPVFVKRNEMHKNHTFPRFTILACEACHRAGTYNVPDQKMSMPGVQSASWDIAGRGFNVPMLVQGAANRACGSCHRAEKITAGEFGDVISFNAHTETFGTLVENDPLDDDDDGLEEEPVLFGIIDKIMSFFE